MELNREHLTEADVYLSAGLPLSWVLEQKDDYLAYLLKKQEVDFLFKGEQYKIRIVGADILPQGYAAIANKLDDLKGMTLLCDIGNGTMNLMYLRDGDAIPDKMYTEKFGTQQCVNAVLEAVMNKYQVVMDEGIVESYLRTGEADVAKEYLKIMKTAASRYAQEILRRLQVHDYTPSLMRMYVVGGGGFFSEKRKRKLLPKSHHCARTFVTARKLNSVPWKSRIRWIVLLKRSLPAGTERSMPICMKIDKVGNHWEKRGQ